MPRAERPGLCPQLSVRCGQQQRPVKQSFCGSLRRDAHWKCLILTLLILGCLAAISWCRLAPPSATGGWDVEDVYPSPSFLEEPSPCNDGYIYIPVAFVIMLYLVYLVECWHSHTRVELQYKVDIASVYERVRAMQEAIPIVWWKAICYHYVRRTRHVTRYRNGDAFTSTQVYYERVNSCTAGSAFNFTHCGVKDVSRKLIGLDDYPATKIRFTKGYSFASVEAECEMEDQRAQFFQEYEARDDYMEGREGIDLLNVNFKEYMIAFADPEHLPWYVSHVIFWVLSFLLLSWPLRVIIEYKTAHLHYHVHKVFGSPCPDEEPGHPNTMSRVSTMNSTDLELNICNNNAIVPSYSEALLMDRLPGRCPSTDANGNVTPSSGAPTPRSLTFTTLPPSRSSSYIRGFFTRSINRTMFTTVRRYSSCNAISERARAMSETLVPADEGVECDDSTLNENDANNMEGSNRRRRWRPWRKRLSGSMHFHTPNAAQPLPSTPETPEDYVIQLHPSRSTVSITRCVTGRVPHWPHRSASGGVEGEDAVIGVASCSEDSGVNCGFVREQSTPPHGPAWRLDSIRCENSVNGGPASSSASRRPRQLLPLPRVGPVRSQDSPDMGTVIWNPRADCSFLPMQTPESSESEHEAPPAYEDALWMRRVSSGGQGRLTSLPRRQRDDEGQRLVSPSTAQRCYRTIHCMETSL